MRGPEGSWSHPVVSHTISLLTNQLLLCMKTKVHPNHTVHIRRWTIFCVFVSLCFSWQAVQTLQLFVICDSGGLLFAYVDNKTIIITKALVASHWAASEDKKREVRTHWQVENSNNLNHCQPLFKAHNVLQLTFLFPFHLVCLGKSIIHIKFCKLKWQIISLKNLFFVY